MGLSLGADVKQLTLLFSISLLFIAGCSNQETLNQSVLTTQEKQQLTEFRHQHEFYSGCVTEEIADIQEMLCDTQGKCLDDMNEAWGYAQWIKVYKACVANKY